jgi:hypothetical protein
VRLRRRLDRQERVREALLLDLGAIIFEQHRQQRSEPELLAAKAAELEAVDDEVRSLTRALGEGHDLPQLTARGLVAACTACGGIMGVRDRHCPGCGAAAGEPAPFEEPAWDEDFEAHAGARNGDEPYEDEHEDEEDTDEVATVSWTPPWRAEPEGDAAPPVLAQEGWSNGFPAPDEDPPPAREALVPKAQRRLRSGRRVARAWLDERRSGGR